MKLLSLFLLLFFSTEVFANKECKKLVRKDCLKNANCRWSKPNKSCVSNEISAKDTNELPTDAYYPKGMKDTNNSISKKCSKITKDNECSADEDCMWNSKKLKCIRKTNPYSQNSIEDSTFDFETPTNK